MKLYLRLFVESVFFAFHALRANKLRTILSLLGITIGIFAIIAVFSMVDSLENKVRSSVESLGDNVVYVQKWPWLFGGDYPWWKFINRPHPDINDYDAIVESSKLAEGVVFGTNFQRKIHYRNKSIGFPNCYAVTHDFDKVREFEIEEGRYFTHLEANNGSPVAIIGFLVSYSFFKYASPVGKTIKIGNQRVKVIGMFSEEGESMIGESMDELVVIPVNYARKFIDIKNRTRPMIQVKGKEGVTVSQLRDELQGILRSSRRLKPKVEDNFALNQTSMLSRAFDDLFKLLNITGLIIGGFSIIVGGFSIANIMFVSVKERINIIGIQKSLGAKNFFILFQFLTESVVLCLIGGLVGLVLIFILLNIVNESMDLDIQMSLNNVITGIVLSISIGIISGIMPAWSAARLNPVDAIRAK